MVEHHVLGNFFPILQLVHLVVSVRVQNGPAEELGQSLRKIDMCISQTVQMLEDEELFKVTEIQRQQTSMSCSS